LVELQLGNITKSKDIELITGSVSLEGKKKMLVGAFYRPTDKTDEDFCSTQLISGRLKSPPITKMSLRCFSLMVLISSLTLFR
jgi:hypothetical protein